MKEEEEEEMSGASVQKPPLRQIVLFEKHPSTFEGVGGMVEIGWMGKLVNQLVCSFMAGGDGGIGKVGKVCRIGGIGGLAVLIEMQGRECLRKRRKRSRQLSGCLHVD